MVTEIYIVLSECESEMEHNSLVVHVERTIEVLGEIGVQFNPQSPQKRQALLMHVEVVECDLRQLNGNGLSKGLVMFFCQLQVISTLTDQWLCKELWKTFAIDTQ